MSKIPAKLVSESLESGEIYVSVASRTRSKGKSIRMEQPKVQQAEVSMKEVDQRLTKFTIEVYEVHHQNKEQFDLIVEMLCGSVRPNQSSNQTAHSLPIVRRNREHFPL